MRTWIRLVLAATLSLAVLLGALALEGSALAGTPGSLEGIGSYVGGITFPGSAPGLVDPLVAWRLPGSGGQIGTCISDGVTGPVSGTYTRTRTVNDAVYAELNHLYLRADDSNRHLAELSALNSHAYDEVNRDVQWGFLQRGQGGLSVADASAMLATAKRLAGPYTVTVGWPKADTRTGVRYIASVQVRSAAGAVVPGASVSLTGTGVALQDRTRVTSSTGLATVGFEILSGTSATVSIAASVPAWMSFDEYSSSGEQSMVVTGQPVPQRGSHTAPVIRTRPVDLVKVEAGDRAHRPVPGYVFRITDSTGHVIRARVTSGTTAVSLGQLLIGASYRVTEIGVPAGAKLYIPKKNTWQFVVPSGVTTWTVSAADPAIPTPRLATSMPVSQVVVGQRLTDHVIISGDDGESGTLTARLLGPVMPPSSDLCSDLDLAAYAAAPSQPVTVPVEGNGLVLVPGPILTRAGCYGWAETLRLTLSGATASSPPTAPHESAVVTTPQLRTQVSTQVLPPGGLLRDDVDVSGLGSESAALQATLYGPLTAPQGCRRLSATAWAGAPVAQVLTTSVTGDGVRALGPVRLTRAGCYTFAEALTPDSTPQHTVHTRRGIATETSAVIAPTLFTSAAPHVVSASGGVVDHVTLRGTSGQAGVVTGSLLGPVAAHGDSCARARWSGAPVAARLAALPIHGDGQYLTAPVTVTKPGCYAFVETLHLVGLTSPIAAGDTGRVAESVLVRPAPVPAQTGVAVGALVFGAGALVLMGVLIVIVGRRRPCRENPRLRVA